MDGQGAFRRMSKQGIIPEGERWRQIRKKAEAIGDIMEDIADEVEDLTKPTVHIRNVIKSKSVIPECIPPGYDFVINIKNGVIVSTHFMKHTESSWFYRTSLKVIFQVTQPSQTNDDTIKFIINLHGLTIENYDINVRPAYFSDDTKALAEESTEGTTESDQEEIAPLQK